MITRASTCIQTPTLLFKHKSWINLLNAVHCKIKRLYYKISICLFLKTYFKVA